MMDFYKLDHDLLTPYTIKNVPKPLGVWDYEGKYTKFKTLGAKRYLVEERGELHLTLAGLSKKNGINYLIEKSDGDNLKVFDLFNDNLFVPATKTGKMTHTYLDNYQESDVVDYLGKHTVIESKSSVHLENCEFTLSIAEKYKSFLINLTKGYIYTGQQNK